MGPRTVASTPPPLSVASRFPDTADKHRQVSESNSRSFTSQPTRIVSPSRSTLARSLFLHILFLFFSPSSTRHPCIIATHHCYIHVSRVISAVDNCDFFSTFRDNDICEWQMVYILYRINIRDSFSNRSCEPKRASKQSIRMSLSECHN